MRTLVLAEHDNVTLNPLTLNAVTCASQIGDVDVIVAGTDCRAVAEDTAKIDGVAKVLLADDESLNHHLAEALAPLLHALMADYDALVAPSTASAKNVLPRACALLDIQPLTDVIEVVAPDTFKRPIYAGNAVAQVKSAQAKNAITARTTAFDPAAHGEGTALIETADVTAVPDPGAAFVSQDLHDSTRPDLTAARAVVSGGRGLGNEENVRLLEDLADVLGGAVGASRAAVDAGFAPNDIQVGQTGKVVAPELYIAAGISGAIQHLAGMKDSRTIVAINTDAEAPIFKVADLGLVADLHEALPELTRALAQMREQ